MKTPFKPKSSINFQESLSKPGGEFRPVGFPSPAEGYTDSPIDLNKELVRNAPATFFAKITGSSLENSGIFDGDILMIDKSLSPKDGRMAVCFVDGDFSLMKIALHQGKLLFFHLNDAAGTKAIGMANHLKIWGIITYIIRKTY